MKKKYIQLGLVVLLLIAMTAALIILQKQPVQEEEAPAAETIYITGSEAAAVPEWVEIRNESGDIRMIYKALSGDEGEWTIEGFEGLSLDSYSIREALKNASMLTAKSVIAENASGQELAAYGLNAPRATVSFSGPDGEEAFLVGADAPGGEGAYVARKGENKVYLVMPSTADCFLQAKLAYINTDITGGNSQSTEFSRITLSGANYPEPIVVSESPETATEAGGMLFNTHRITSPVDSAIDSQNGLAPLREVFGLHAVKVADVGDDMATLEKYGLAQPVGVIDVQTKDEAVGSFTLRVSRTDADGNVYLIKSGSPVIYALPENYLPWLSLSLFEMREKMILLPYIDSVAAVRVTVPGKTYSFALSGEGDGLTVTQDGKTLPDVPDSTGKTVSGADNFRQFYQTLIAARYEEETEDTPPENAESVLRIEYAYRDGRGADVVSFYAGPVRRVLVSLNGGEYYLSPSSYTDRVIADVESVAQGAAVKSYF